MTYRFDRFTEKEAARSRQIEIDEAADRERARLAARTMWERIWDLHVSNDLKDVLWALADKAGAE